jgi:hypothetical protein
MRLSERVVSLESTSGPFFVAAHNRSTRVDKRLARGWRRSIIAAMPSRARRSAVLCALVTVVLAAPAAAHAATPLVRTSVDTRFRGARLPSSFLGFSQEYNLMRTWLGIPAIGVNPILVNVFKQLTSYGSGAPVLRLGGGSADSAWWNPTGRPKPRGIAFNVNNALMLPLSQFVQQTGGTTILGLNLANRHPSYAVDLAKAAMASLPHGSIRAFELGNEPDIYNRRPVVPGKPGFTRGKHYSPKAYLREINPFLTGLRHIPHHPPIAGPGLCCVAKWVQAMPQIINRTAGRLGLITMHRYPLDACDKKPGQKGYPKLRDLLNPRALRGARDFRFEALLARRHHIGLRVTETNSAACGGAKGVSDTFASTLWAAQWAFTVSLYRVSGMDFHTSSATYSPFSFAFTRRGWIGVMHPEMYGLLLFAEATAHRAIPLPRTVARARRRRRANVWTWGFYDPTDHVVRVVVLNLGPGRTHGPAVVAVGGGRGTGTLKRLSAPSIRAKTGITWGGQAYPPTTTTGDLAGALRTSRVHRGHGGVYRFSMPAAGAALLTVRV